MSKSDEQPPKRNIDERIDALTMNLELLTHEVASLRTGIAELTTTVARLTSVVETLARSVIGHERRITSLEDGQPA